MVNLTLAVGGLWGTIINWLQSFIPSFGLTIIVVTILIKILMSPLEVYQKISTKKNSEKQAEMQPALNKINKQYANNKDMLNKKTMELYKKHNYNVMGSCLGMLINLVLTLVIFITFFNALNAISQDNIRKEYQTLQTEYSISFKQSLIESAGTSVAFTEQDTIQSFVDKLKASLGEETTDAYIESAQAAARDSVSKKYGQIKESFLWIENIYRPDTWSTVFPNFDEYVSISQENFKTYTAENPFVDVYGNSYTTEETAKEAFKLQFNEVTAQIEEDYSGWNGWLILVILSAGVTILSQVITAITNKPKKQYDKKGNEIPVQNPANNKLLLFLLPALMIVFAIQYSAAFALYLVVNSAMSVLIGLLTTLIMNKIEKRKQEKSQNKLVKDTKEV